MTAGKYTNTAAKARQRSRVGSDEREKRKELAERLKEFFSLGRIKYADVKDDAEHITDLVAEFQMYQAHRGVIVSVQFPAAYAHDVLTVKQAGRVLLRVYSLSKMTDALDDADLPSEGLDDEVAHVDDL